MTSSPTGKVYQWEDPDSKLFDHPHVLNPPESTPVSRLTQTEVYKELRLRGYDYGPHFQGIVEASLEGGQECPRVSEHGHQESFLTAGPSPARRQGGVLTQPLCCR